MSTMEPYGEITKLPFDVIYQVMLYLDPKSLSEVMQIPSNAFRQVCEDNSFWNQRIKIDFPDILDFYEPNNARMWWIVRSLGTRVQLRLDIQIDLHSYIDPFWGKYQNNPETDQIIIDYFREMYLDKFNIFYNKEASKNGIRGRIFSKEVIILIKDDALIAYVKPQKVDGEFIPLQQKEQRLVEESFRDLFDYDEFNYENSFSDLYEEIFGVEYRTHNEIETGSTFCFRVSRTLNIG